LDTSADFCSLMTEGDMLPDLSPVSGLRSLMVVALQFCRLSKIAHPLKKGDKRRREEVMVRFKRERGRNEVQCGVDQSASRLSLCVTRNFNRSPSSTHRPKVNNTSLDPPLPQVIFTEYYIRHGFRCECFQIYHVRLHRQTDTCAQALSNVYKQVLSCPHLHPTSAN